MAVRVQWSDTHFFGSLFFCPGLHVLVCLCISYAVFIFSNKCSECVAVLRTLASVAAWRPLLKSMLRETLLVVIPLISDTGDVGAGGVERTGTPAQAAVQAWGVGRTTEDKLTLALGSLAVMGGLHADGLREGGRLVCSHMLFCLLPTHSLLVNRLGGCACNIFWICLVLHHGSVLVRLADGSAVPATLVGYAPGDSQVCHSKLSLPNIHATIQVYSCVLHL